MAISQEALERIAKVRGEEAEKVLQLFKDSGLTKRDFCENGKVTVAYFDKKVKDITPIKPEIAREIRAILQEKKMEGYTKMRDRVTEVVELLRIGVERPDGKRRAFNILDYDLAYNFSSKYPLEKLVDIARRANTAKEIKAISDFEKATREKRIPTCREEVLARKTPINGKPMSPQAINSIFNWLRDQGLKVVTRGDYTCALARYLRGELERTQWRSGGEPHAMLRSQLKVIKETADRRITEIKQTTKKLG